MNRVIEKGKTLLVDGPASVTILSGSIEVFGSTMRKGAKVVIRESKRLPFLVAETSEFEISLGESAAIDEVDGSTIPSSWLDAADQFLNFQMKPAVALVVGPVDSGKTSFCTYLTNRMLSRAKKGAILDGDIGQSDIGPPCTVAYAFVTKPMTDLFNLEARNAFFVGDTSPGVVAEKVMEGLVSLKKEVLESEPEFLVIDTDGWVDGECAVNYKVELIEKLNPSVIFCIKQNGEMLPLVSALDRFRSIIVESPSMARQRDREKRKSLRELGYTKYLRNAKIQSILLNWLKIEGNELLGLCTTRMSQRQMGKICELLGMRPLHVSESSDTICVVVGRNRWINLENIKKLEERSRKKVVVTRKGEEEGLLSGIYAANGKFLGIGVLQEIDYLRKTLKILTSVPAEISTIVLGRVKLDKKMKEIRPILEDTGIDFSSLKKLF